MALSQTEKQAMIRATHETAWAMVEDLDHIREVLAPSAGDIRRMSNVLRRILIDNNGDLRKIGTPRIGRVHLLVPDILPLVRSGEKKPYAFLSAGVADVFGISIDAWMMEQSSQVRNVNDYEPGRTAEVRIDGFLSQKVICFNGQWVSRGETIKYIANIAHGVHSGTAKEPNEELLRRIRHIATISLENELPTLSFNSSALANDEKPLSINRKAIDFVLVQLISAARYLTISPDVQKLEELIRNEAP